MGRSKEKPSLACLRLTWSLSVLLFALGSLMFTKEPCLSRLEGLAVAWFLAGFVGLIASWGAASWDVASPKTTEKGVETRRVDLIQRGDRRGTSLLGLAEATLFYFSFAASAFELAAAWLVFKTATKWAAWQHIMRLPSEVEGIDTLDYLRYRHNLSSSLATGFMLGTIANILVGAAGLVAMLLVASAS